MKLCYIKWVLFIFFLSFTFGFHGFHLKELKIIPYDFLTWHAEENLVVNNKDNRDNRVYMSLMFLKLAYLF